MPLTVDLYPGKKISINGQSIPFGPRVAPSARPDYEAFNRSCLASGFDFKLFQDIDGRPLSLNQMGINQDNHGETLNHEDLNFMVNAVNKYPTVEQQWELLEDSFKIQVPKPRNIPTKVLGQLG